MYLFLSCLILLKEKPGVQLALDPSRVQLDLVPHALGFQSAEKTVEVFAAALLSWALHIRNICNKAARNLGYQALSQYQLRLTKHFNDIHSLKITVASFGHRTSTTLWTILRRNRRVLRLVGIRLGYRYTEVPIQDIATFLNIPSLSSRRCIQDVMFFYHLINAELDCPDLLEKINFNASFGTRAMNSFTKVAASSSYTANGPMLRIQWLGNNIPSTLDIFIASTSAIKSRLASL
ncbi:hypothetical protein J6590_049667 [Homalodisca vitripennis]|nr:hypothetical protein J6590_049667 [Homalodisca vitripennis]